MQDELGSARKKKKRLREKVSVPAAGRLDGHVTMSKKPRRYAGAATWKETPGRKKNAGAQLLPY